MDASLPRLTAAQAAARLGVRQQTLYAYVSRGLLARERGAHGSTFDALEIERFASSRRRSGRGAREDQSAGTSGSPLMVLDTDIALIEDGELFLRGVSAAELALKYPYESVARWLWGAELQASAPVFAPDEYAIASARAAVAALGRAPTPLDRVQVAVPVLGAADPTRHDLDPDAVRAAAERMIAGVVATLGGPVLPSSPAEKSRVAMTARELPRNSTSRTGEGAPEPGGLAAAVWQAFTDRTPSAAEVRALNAALVLLVDHDLAVSTLAARAAASARATPYAVVSSGLGALDSALHGNASGAACELIRLVLAGTDARTALAQTVARTARPAPGFGHSLYPGIDARAGILLQLVAELPEGAVVVDAVDRLAAEVLSRTGRHPNVDLALAALTIAARMPSDAGAAIFAIGRMAGWIAHALDEYGQRPLRLRPRGRYVGPDAGTPARTATAADE
ncbi:citrate/2-methylcitrate synthase [Humibacter ginsengisoli]